MARRLGLAREFCDFFFFRFGFRRLEKVLRCKYCGGSGGLEAVMSLLALLEFCWMLTNV